MKNTLYIPAGETYRFENLTCERIVVSGSLRVDGAIRATHISGAGFIWAGDISAAAITASTIDAGMIVADRLIADRVVAVEIHVTQSAAISCYLEAERVKAAKITLTDASISDLDAGEVVYLKPRPRSLFGTLLASRFQTLIEDFFYHPAALPSESREAPVPEPPAQQDTAPETLAEIKALLEDMEFRRMKAMFDLTRGGNYVWKLMPADKPAGRAVHFVSGPAEEASASKGVAA